MKCLKFPIEVNSLEPQVVSQREAHCKLKKEGMGFHVQKTVVGHTQRRIVKVKMRIGLKI